MYEEDNHLFKFKIFTCFTHVLHVNKSMFDNPRYLPVVKSYLPLLGVK